MIEPNLPVLQDLKLQKRAQQNRIQISVAVRQYSLVRAHSSEKCTKWREYGISDPITQQNSVCGRQGPAVMNGY